MSRSTLGLSDQVKAYLEQVGYREPNILRRLREETAKLPMAGMQISPEQGAFMALMGQLMGAKRYLEVGVFTGYSALGMALSLPPDGRIVACDVNKEWTDIARRYWREAGVEAKIDLHLKPAQETLAALIAAGEVGQFDFAFIDADKMNYGVYYEQALTLLRPGGLLCIDNVLWSGRVADQSVTDVDTAAIRDLNARIAEDRRIQHVLLPVSDGLSLVLKL